MSPGDEVKMGKVGTESSTTLNGLTQLQELMATGEQPPMGQTLARSQELACWPRL